MEWTSMARYGNDKMIVYVEIEESSAQSFVDRNDDTVLSSSLDKIHWTRSENLELLK